MHANPIQTCLLLPARQTLLKVCFAFLSAITTNPHTHCISIPSIHSINFCLDSFANDTFKIYRFTTTLQCQAGALLIKNATIPIQMIEGVLFLCIYLEDLYRHLFFFCVPSLAISLGLLAITFKIMAINSGDTNLLSCMA